MFCEILRIFRSILFSQSVFELFEIQTLGTRECAAARGLITNVLIYAKKTAKTAFIEVLLNNWISDTRITIHSLGNDFYLHKRPFPSLFLCCSYYRLCGSNYRFIFQHQDEPLRAEDSSESEDEDMDESPSPTPVPRFAPMPSSTSETVAAMHFHPSLGYVKSFLNIRL